MPVGSFTRRDVKIFIDGGRKHITVVVVCMFANKVDSAGGGCDESRGPTEGLFKLPCDESGSIGFFVKCFEGAHSGAGNVFLILFGRARGPRPYV